MRNPRRSPEANVLRDLERQLDELRAEVRSARAESAASFAQVDRMARVIRVSRRTLTEAEMQAGWDRLAPDLSLIRWKPRSGEPDRPELGSGLIDRLKAGDPVSDTLGNTAPFVGATNAIVDPLLEALGSPGKAVGTSDTEVGGDWRASYALASGAISSAPTVDDLYWRGAVADNPYNSKIIGIDHYGSTSAHDLTTYVWQNETLGTYQTRLPYVVAAVQVQQLSGFDAAYTTAEVTIELVNTATSTVVASTTLNLLTVPDEAPRALSCHAIVAPPSAYYRWRLVFHTVKAASAGSAGADVFFGEPQLHFSYTTDPLPFQPTVAIYHPSELRNYSSAGTHPRLKIEESIRFGPGDVSEDVELKRVGVGKLELENGGSTAATSAILRIGNDYGSDAYGLEVRGGAAPPDPASGVGLLYFGTDDRWHQVDDASNDYVLAVRSEAAPSGAMMLYGGTAAPTGWLLCDGTAVSRTTYADLFTAIGTAFGVGDGSTTFNVPDLRGQFPLGKAASGTGSTLGGTGGSIDHTHTGPSHTHSGSTGSTSLNQVSDAAQTGTGARLRSPDPHSHTIGADGTGATGAANPPFLAVNFIIKV